MFWDVETQCVFPPALTSSFNPASPQLVWEVSEYAITTAPVSQGGNMTHPLPQPLLPWRPVLLQTCFSDKSVTVHLHSLPALFPSALPSQPFVPLPLLNHFSSVLQKTNHLPAIGNHLSRHLNNSYFLDLCDSFQYHIQICKAGQSVKNVFAICVFTLKTCPCPSFVSFHSSASAHGWYALKCLSFLTQLTVSYLLGLAQMPHCFLNPCGGVGPLSMFSYCVAIIFLTVVTWTIILAAFLSLATVLES